MTAGEEISELSTLGLQNLDAATNDSDVYSTRPLKNTPSPPIPRLQKVILLIVFSFAAFLDTFNNAALFAAIPVMTPLLHLSGGQPIWLISAYQMLMSSFLLICGRMTDLYSPKIIFITGVVGIVVLSIVGGFVQEKIGLIVIRALLGICAAFTIPSALSLVVYLFPDPKAQAGALGTYGACGAIGNVLGIIIGAVLTQFGSWRWCFYFVAIAAAPIAPAAFILLPNGITIGETAKTLRGREKLKSIDLFGIFLVTAGLLLFAFALIQATTIGWGRAGVLVPLLLGVALVIAFFYYETKLPKGKAALPPHIWFYPNFLLIACLSLVPYGFANVIATLLSPYWQEQLGWSVIKFAVHFLPLGISTIIFYPLVGGILSHLFYKKWFPTMGLLIMAAGAIVLAFADSPNKYWSYDFHTFIWGCFGFVIVYLFVNVAIFNWTPPSMAGTVGAILNASLQLGSALGTAIATTIQQGVEAKQKGTDFRSKYAGCAAAFIFYASLLVFAAIMTFIFYNPRAKSQLTSSQEEVDQSLSVPSHSDKDSP